MTDIDSKKIIKLNDFELNLIHGLLVNEEKNVNNTTKILVEKGGHYNNFKYYVDSLKDLRNRFTQMDDTEDLCGAFERIDAYKLDENQNMQEQLKIRDERNVITSLDELDEYLINLEDSNK